MFYVLCDIDLNMKRNILLVILVSITFGFSQEILHTETYPDGNIKRISFHQKTNEKIEITRLEEFYPNGRPLLTGNYKNGVRHGLWVHMYENGLKKEEQQYSGDKQYQNKWYESGQIEEEGHFFKDDSGITCHNFIRYYETGSKMKELYHYNSNERVFSTWNENGLMKSQEWNDIYTIDFNEDGTIRYEATYWAGIADVMHKSYDNGVLVDKGFFQNNCHEREPIYTESGVVDDIGNRIKCPEEYLIGWEGSWIFRYDNGNKMIERIYIEGSLLEKNCWEESGNECECGQYWWDGCK